MLAGPAHDQTPEKRMSDQLRKKTNANYRRSYRAGKLG
jgi:hypothetical protein